MRCMYDVSERNKCGERSAREDAQKRKYFFLSLSRDLSRTQEGPTSLATKQEGAAFLLWHRREGKNGRHAERRNCLKCFDADSSSYNPRSNLPRFSTSGRVSISDGQSTGFAAIGSARFPLSARCFRNHPLSID